ncbi:hypothetical protein K501DRAFT_332401 [Backusella circina FSU 941]|nr:hypothetical protein K501DRAFT_332401 [Backusella circina FSU 941]
MSSNITAEEELGSMCPTPPGLESYYGGFNPGLDWASVKENPSDNWHVIGWMTCLALLVATWIITIINIRAHVRNYYKPEIQRHKLRVILFPAFYSTLSWLSYLSFKYATTIMLFATLFEAFAVFNLYSCLEAYLQPFRDQAPEAKEPCDTKIMFMFKCHIKSKWGMHYRILNDILVFQFPIWTVIKSFIAIATSLHGRYCSGVYSFAGSYVYLVIINFFSLSIILTALFTYLDVYHHEFTEAKVPAHGLFWCVKGPIMANFYLGEVLLTILSTCGVIHGTQGNPATGSIAWPAEAVKNGLEVIVYCVVMTISAVMMLRYFGNNDPDFNPKAEKLTVKQALFDGYVSYIPEFLSRASGCCSDAKLLRKKRRELKLRKNNSTVSPEKYTYHDVSKLESKPTPVTSNADISPMTQPTVSRDS